MGGGESESPIFFLLMVPVLVFCWHEPDSRRGWQAPCPRASLWDTSPPLPPHYCLQGVSGHSWTAPTAYQKRETEKFAEKWLLDAAVLTHFMHIIIAKRCPSPEHAGELELSGSLY